MPDSLIRRRDLVLGIDTSAGACSVALIRDGKVCARESRLMRHGHAEALLPMVRLAMSAWGSGFPELAAVGATIGPGSFTGLRVGLAAARGIALAVGVPCIGVTSLEALAFAADAGRQGAPAPLLAVLDTRRGDLYAQIFKVDGTPAGGPFLAQVEDLPARLSKAGVRLPEVLIVGDVAVSVRRDLGLDAPCATLGNTIEMPAGAAIPDAASVAAIAAQRLNCAADHPARPLYLRAAQVTMSPGGGTLRP